MTRNWYPRPTPPDLLFEERELGIRAAYSSEIYNLKKEN